MESDWIEFERRQVRVAAIAAQKIRGFLQARRFVLERAFPFPVLFDETRKTIKDYGVYHRLGRDAFRIAHPAVFVLNAEATIRWIAISRHQRARPSTEQILEAVDQVRASGL